MQGDEGRKVIGRLYGTWRGRPRLRRCTNSEHLTRDAGEESLSALEDKARADREDFMYFVPKLLGAFK